MTFSHKTINILFHIRKFLSGKDAVNTLYGGLVENAGTRICGYAGMRVRRTGLTNRFQKLINNSNKIIAVNTKNHSCEGVFICGKTHVDFHKTVTSIFSAYTTSIY